MDRSEVIRLYPRPGLLIGGKHTGASEGGVFGVYDPATESQIAEFPAANEAQVQKSLDLAEVGFHLWRRQPPDRRGEILLRAANLILENGPRLAGLVTLELGKPFREALAEVDTAASMFRWAAEETRRLYGRQIPAREPDAWQLAILEPVGPVAAFSSWNAPVITPARKISGALAAGCSILLKAAEETPACALELARLVIEAGVPPEAISVLFGDPARISEHLLSSKTTKAVTFTGSTAIGRMISMRAAETFKQQVMELGGHAPVIILNDVDVESLAAEAVKAKFRNSGQVCTAPTRFFVQGSRYEEFVDAFTRHAKQLTLGCGFDSSTTMGPLAHARRKAAVSEIAEDARRRGLRITAGGHERDRVGYFYEPTVIADATPQSAIANQEPFGPVAMIAPFQSLDEALEQANRLPMGLAGYLFTHNLSAARQLSLRLEVGNVAVNGWRASLPETPFGGVKDSGLGREGGSEGVLAFTRTKFISLA